MAESDRVLRLVRLAGGVGLVAIAGLVTLADGRSEASLQNVDFIWDYWVAGRLMLSGQAKAIYALGSPELWPPAFSAAAHALLPGLRPELAVPFVYPPAMVCLLAPFSLLSPQTALFAFQAVSVGALLAAAWLVSSLPSTRGGTLEVFCSAFALLFVAEQLIMGQAGLVVGLLPLTGGYALWQRGRPFAAGLAWSVLSLKMQLALPVVLLLTALVLARAGSRRAELREPLQVALGFGLGGLGLALLALPFFGWEGYRDWVLDVRQFNLNLNDPNGIRYTQFTIGSLPELISESGGERGRALGALMSVLAAVASVIGLAAIDRWQATLELKRDAMMTLAVASLLVVAPYFRLYDSTALLLPAWIVVYRFPGVPAVRWVGLTLVGGLWLLLDGYFVKLWFDLASPSA